MTQRPRRRDAAREGRALLALGVLARLGLAGAIRVVAAASSDRLQRVDALRERRSGMALDVPVRLAFAGLAVRVVSVRGAGAQRIGILGVVVPEGIGVRAVA